MRLQRSEGVKLGDVVYVRYLDHVLFRDADPSQYEPAMRETMGWLMKETEEAVWILWDRSVHLLPHERIQPRESGLIILKSDIIEMRKIA